MIKHGLLVMTTYSTEVTQEATTMCNHIRKHDFLKGAKERVKLTNDVFMKMTEARHNLTNIILEYIHNMAFDVTITFDSRAPRTFTITSMTVSCIPRALIRLGC